MAYKPENIVRLQEFDADPDVEIIIGSSEQIWLMPILRWQANHWAEATGDYDLCLSEDQLKYMFFNRRGTTEKFAYRFISTYWLSNRLGRPF